MKNLMRENYGDLKSLQELGKIKQNSFTIEQLLDEKLKNVGGENRIEVTNRMEKALRNILLENLEKNIAIVSHGAAIKFLLMKWCTLNKDNQLEFNGKILNINTPAVLRLKFDGEDLTEIKQIV